MINNDNENFDLLAVNDQMQVLWKKSFIGFALAVDKFKNKVVAIASTDHSGIKGSNNTYKGFILDAANGKTLAEKVIFTGSDEYMTYPIIYTGEGAYLKLAVRQSGLKRKLHVGLPFLGGFSINGYAKEFNETHDLQVLDLNEQLDPIATIKPAISNGSFINIRWNKQADMFVGWLNGPSIEVYRYDAGKTTPSAQLTADVVLKEDKSSLPGEYILFTPSEVNNSILYYSLLYINTNKDAELGIGKFDFKSGKKQYVTQVLDKDNLKAVKKAFVPVNKKIDDVNTGYGKGMKIRYMNEISGVLVTTLSSTSSESSSIGSGRWQMEASILINGYDANLNLKYQQYMPVSYSNPNFLLPTGYHSEKNKLYIVANNKDGMVSLKSVYGAFDVTTGQWDKMDYLSKKKINNSAYSAGGAILWFGNSYIVPYMAPKGLMSIKYDVTLQQDIY